MLTRCLICHEIIYQAFGWRTIILPSKEPLICSQCEHKLDRIEGETCRICGRPFGLLDQQFRHEDLCNDCVRWEEDLGWQGYLDQNISIFLYNDFLKEVMAKYKFRGDYVLSKVFAAYIKGKLPKADFYVPIPLSEERLYERGFNQAEAIIKELDLQPTLLLTRIHSEKQSKKKRSERIHLPQVFQVNESIHLEGKSIVLIDDIYTTGSTLRHAAKLLKGAGAEHICSLTVAR
jgi:competence protein ComFC